MAYQRPYVRVQKIHEYLGHRAPIFSLCEDKKGFFYSAAGDGLIVQWDSQSLSDGKALLQAKTSFFSIELLAPSLLAAGSSDGALYFYDLPNHRLLKTVQAHQKNVFQILNVSDEFFCSVGGDGILHLWDLQHLHIVQSLAISTQSLRTVLYDKKNQRIFIGASDSYIHLLEWEKGQIKWKTKWRAHVPSVLNLIQTSNYLISTGRDASIRVWDLSQNFYLLHEIPAHIQSIHHLELNPDHTYMLSASMDKLLKLWDIQNDFRLIKVIDKNRNDSHTASINHILWIEYNDSIITCSDDRKIIQWMIEINPQEKE